MTAKLLRFGAQLLAFARGDSDAAAVVQTITVRVVLLVVNFGTGILIARSLGPSGRGEQAAIALWPIFLATLATLGIPTALRYHIRREPESSPHYYVASFLMMLLLGIVAGALGVIIMPLLLHGYEQSVVRAAQAFMIFAPQVLLTYVVRAQLEAVGDFRRAILSQLNPNIVTLLVLVVLRLSDHITPLSAALSYAVPSTLQTLALAVRLWPRKSSKAREVATHGRALLGYGLRSYGTDVIGAFASQLDLAVIVTFLSAAQLGLYTIALSLSRLLNIVQMSLVSVIFPRASALGIEKGIPLITRAARLSTAISIVLGAFFLLTIPMALPRMYGADFSAAIALMPLLTLEAIIGGLGSVLNQSFLAIGRPFVVTLIEAGSIITALGLLFVLVPRMNVAGAATALLATSVVRAAVIMTAYRIVLDQPLPQLLPTSADLMYLRQMIAKLLPKRPVGLAKEA